MTDGTLHLIANQHIYIQYRSNPITPNGVPPTFSKTREAVSMKTDKAAWEEQAEALDVSSSAVMCSKALQQF